jgi:hypothetical protein
MLWQGKVLSINADAEEVEEAFEVVVVEEVDVEDAAAVVVPEFDPGADAFA